MTRHGMEVPASFEHRFAKLLEQAPNANTYDARNPGEVFRQYASWMTDKLDAAFEPSDSRSGLCYASADELVDDLRFWRMGYAAATAQVSPGHW